MAGKRIDPSTIDEKAILEIVAGKNNQIGLSHGVSHKIKIAVGNSSSEDSTKILSEKVIKSGKPVDLDQIESYRAVFLGKETLIERQALHIEKSLHRRIAALVNAAGGRASVSGFVTRVLAKHFDEYASQIDILLEQYYKSLKRE